LSGRQLLSERLANFKFTANPNAIEDTSLTKGSKYNGKEDELDSEDEAAFQNQPAADDMDIVVEAPGGQDPPDAEPQDFFAGDEGGGGDDYGGDYGGGGDFADASGEPGDMPTGEGGEQPGPGQPGFVPFDPRRAPDQRELVMAMAEDGGASMMDYFDASITKNWAGPEHWKLRKVIRKRTQTAFLVFLAVSNAVTDS
jgi:condensin complex subunit 2